jgi:hypothetical protein
MLRRRFTFLGWCVYGSVMAAGILADLLLLARVLAGEVQGSAKWLYLLVGLWVIPGLAHMIGMVVGAPSVSIAEYGRFKHAPLAVRHDPGSVDEGADGSRGLDDPTAPGRVGPRTLAQEHRLHGRGWIEGAGPSGALLAEGEVRLGEHCLVFLSNDVAIPVLVPYGEIDRLRQVPADEMVLEAHPSVFRGCSGATIVTGVAKRGSDGESTRSFAIVPTDGSTSEDWEAAVVLGSHLLTA